MTRHRCVLNDSNGFVCDVCDRKREKAMMDFDADYLPKLRALLKEMRLLPGTHGRFEDKLLDYYVEARMEDGDES